MLTGLSILGDTGFEFTDTSGDDDYLLEWMIRWKHTNGTISLRRSSDHVLDEITMSRGINDGDIVFGCLKLPKSNVNGDTTFTLGF